ncbi:MAG: inositol-phosphate phosphatase [Steroidobacteraceae bacterium]|jgi:histidinol-phosphatase|nr:inositol-phosphate phosphatase [Steroidobacteraceae bacterium]
MSHSPHLRAALDAAAAAAEVIRGLYRQNVRVEVKADKTPVTEADVGAERAIRAVLEARFPGYGFFGEETGSRAMESEYVWLVDPIDGTKAFVREYPMFSTQIALMHRGALVLGVSSAPVYGELAWAERGQGAFLDGQPLQVSDIAELSSAALSAGNLKSLARSDAWDRYGGIVAEVSRIRGYGDFLHYHLLAAGKIDAVIESDLNILDIAALAVIVEEAGGRVTDLAGGPVTLATTSLLATNGRLHDLLLERMRWGR